VKNDQLKKAIDGMRAFQIQGMNVTIPHKLAIMPFLDEIDPLAKQIGAINTIKNMDGRLIGRNTDGEAAIQAILEAGITLKNKKVVIIGTGGAARAIAFYMAKETEYITLINRSQPSMQKLKENLEKYYAFPIKTSLQNDPCNKGIMAEADILINTTPIGMIPKIEESPILAEYLHHKLFVFDIVYNPMNTKLLQQARECGCKTLGGLDMLINQGALAFEWWTGKKPNRQLMKQRVMEYIAQKNQQKEEIIHENQ
jgi:shikimate dehydrogenase